MCLPMALLLPKCSVPLSASSQSLFPFFCTVFCSSLPLTCFSTLKPILPCCVIGGISRCTIHNVHNNSCCTQRILRYYQQRKHLAEAGWPASIVTTPTPALPAQDHFAPFCYACHEYHCVQNIVTAKIYQLNIRGHCCIYFLFHPLTSLSGARPCRLSSITIAAL